MRHLVFALVILFVSACNKDLVKQAPQNSLLLVQVDFLTFNFEAAAELSLTSPLTDVDSLPISNVYKSPGDFGNISFFYQPGNDLIFDGSIVWMGLGTMSYPSMTPASNFSRSIPSLQLPDTAKFQHLFSQHPQHVPLDSIWMNIADLEVVKTYSQSSKNIGIFVYAPSVGMGDPADWDWFLVFNK